MKQVVLNINIYSLTKLAKCNQFQLVFNYMMHGPHCLTHVSKSYWTFRSAEDLTICLRIGLDLGPNSKNAQFIKWEKHVTTKGYTR